MWVELPPAKDIGFFASSLPFCIHDPLVLFLQVLLSQQASTFASVSVFLFVCLLVFFVCLFFCSHKLGSPGHWKFTSQPIIIVLNGILYVRMSCWLNCTTESCINIVLRNIFPRAQTCHLESDSEKQWHPCHPWGFPESGMLCSKLNSSPLGRDFWRSVEKLEFKEVWVTTYIGWDCMSNG